jgi:broad specificity phosphatase PhoE
MIPEELAAQVAAAVGDGGGLLVLRHSVREAITSAQLSAAMAAPLTEEGRALARHLGGLLGPVRPLRLFWSPVPRCQETAALLGEGTGGRGGEVELAGAREYLGATYVLDPEGVTERFARLGQDGFVARWLGGRLPGLLQPMPEAGRQLLAALMDEHRASDGRLDVHVTHDLTLFTLLSVAFDVGAPGFRWPGYLEGALLLPRHGELFWHYGSLRAQTAFSY